MLIKMKEERGVAMVVALLVVFVVLILSTVVISQAIHSTEQSARNRDRVFAVDASEAGLNSFYNYLQTSTIQEIRDAPHATEATAMIQVLDTAPTTAQFSAVATYYDAAGNVMAPATFTSKVFPASAYIRSVGTTTGESPRTMETFVELTPIYGGFGAAIISNNGLNLSNNLTLNGFTTNDADIYVNNGDANISNQPTVYGSVYVSNGNATLSNSTTVWQHLWANGSVNIGNSSGVIGNVTSSLLSIACANNSTIGGNATAGTTISCTNVGGTPRPNTLQGPPPPQPLPEIPWVEADWTDPNKTTPDLPYEVRTFTECGAALAYLTSGTLTPADGRGGIVVRIAAVCALQIANNTNISVNGNLAVVTDGSFQIVNQSTWTGQGARRKFFLIAAYRAGLDCASGAYNISASNNTNLVNADVLAYSPCTVNWANQNEVSGQVLAGTVNITNQFTMNFVPVLVPGVGEVTGFKQDIAYIREVVNG